MRPKTLAEVALRTIEGDSFDRCLANFLDEFYAAPSSAARGTCLSAKTPWPGQEPLRQPSRLPSLAPRHRDGDALMAFDTRRQRGPCLVASGCALDVAGTVAASAARRRFGWARSALPNLPPPCATPEVRRKPKRRRRLRSTGALHGGKTLRHASCPLSTIHPGSTLAALRRAQDGIKLGTFSAS